MTILTQAAQVKASYTTHYDDDKLFKMGNEYAYSFNTFENNEIVTAYTFFFMLDDSVLLIEQNSKVRNRDVLLVTVYSHIDEVRSELKRLEKAFN